MSHSRHLRFSCRARAAPTYCIQERCILTCLYLQGGWDVRKGQPANPTQASAFKELERLQRKARTAEDKLHTQSTSIDQLRDIYKLAVAGRKPNSRVRDTHFKKLQPTITTHSAICALGGSLESSAWGWSVNPSSTPMQVNDSDCGPCMLEAIRAVPSSAPQQDPDFRYSGVAVKDVRRRVQSIELWEGIVRLPGESAAHSARVERCDTPSDSTLGISRQ